ncbi:hypothetical protein [Heyndrickxia ginsengihumi]|uniref:hypothetical protein n=1 Tax=Heyndrickxia ginsengihumi TaxID=363870 RepID=UPI003D1DC055
MNSYAKAFRSAFLNETNQSIFTLHACFTGACLGLEENGTLDDFLAVTNEFRKLEKEISIKEAV